jgi:hypothetical protein
MVLAMLLSEGQERREMKAGKGRRTVISHTFLGTDTAACLRSCSPCCSLQGRKYMTEKEATQTLSTSAASKRTSEAHSSMPMTALQEAQEITGEEADDVSYIAHIIPEVYTGAERGPRVT